MPGLILAGKKYDWLVIFFHRPAILFGKPKSLFRALRTNLL